MTLTNISIYTHNTNSLFHTLNKYMEKIMNTRLVKLTLIGLFCGLLIALASCKSSCSAGYCDAYGSNDVVVEIDRV